MCKPCFITAILFLVIVIGGFLFLWNEARAEGENSVIINEIQISDAEFIELHNTNSEEISLEGWYLAYYSASREDWDNPWRLKPFSEATEPVIAAGGYFVIGLKGYPEPASNWQIYTSRQLNDHSGTIAIFSYDPTKDSITDPEPMDAVGWGATSLYLKTPVSPVPGKGQSMGRGTNTRNNQNDFEIQDPTPGTINSSSTNTETEPEEDTTTETQEANNDQSVDSSQEDNNQANEQEQETLNEQDAAKEIAEEEEESPKEAEPEPTLIIDYPLEIDAQHEMFSVSVSISGVPDTDYDLKISILNTEDKNISNIYNINTNEWGSAHFYIQNAFNGTSYNGNFLKNIRDEYLTHTGEGKIIAQLRQAGKSNIFLRTKGALSVQGAPEATEDRTPPPQQSSTPRATATEKDGDDKNEEDVETLTPEALPAQADSSIPSFIPFVIAGMLSLAGGVVYLVVRQRINKDEGV